VTAPDALIVWGGWDGHEPEPFAEHYAGVLRAEGLTVEVSPTLDSFCDADRLRALSLIVPIWTMGEIRPDQLGPLLAAVESGVGLAGFHGGMGDAFHDACEFQFMVGGQFVAHPDGIKDYEVTITDRDSPLTDGMSDFRMHSEQYYMHVDPSNHVLATTIVDPESAPWIDRCVMPVAWTRRWGAGQVFYSSLGHTTADLDVPEVGELQRRGMMWAAR
jgi:uncharacterized protein